MRIENLKAGYHKNVIIQDLSLELGKGEVLSLIGPNGGGKSTLLKSISGQIKPLGGTVFIGKDDIKHIPVKQLSKRMSIVTTERVRTQHMTCRDVVMAGRLPYSDSLGLFSKDDQSSAGRAMELMNIGDLADKSYEALSDGQKQRALIARAICQEPEYLIMDEPTSYLDIRHKLDLMDVVKKLSSEGVSIIMTLHEPQLALRISERVLMVRQDGSAECASPKEVIESGMIKELYGLTDEMYSFISKSFV
ncbi:ABC-type cobalamin/Fe3+-siderophores transport system, ATPase component [Lachnospiraceae bacterium]|nr:ABC-type cobalamin/Fe3+-siderophores transport system, ATPase component [Lachnospiraceae bacterium]